MPRKRNQKGKKSNRRKRTPRVQQQEWYEISQILDRRVTRDKVEYLVDWKDNQVTGERYSPSWSEEVTEVALREWNEKQGATSNQSQAGDTAQPADIVQDDEDQDDEDQDEDQDQDPRPSNWGRLKRTALDADLPQGRLDPDSAESESRARKRIKLRITSSQTSDDCSESESNPGRRIKLTITSSRWTSPEEPAPSVTEASSDYESRSPVSITSSDHLRLQQQTLTVEISKPTDFYSDDYQSVPNSQSTRPLSELEDEDSRIALSPNFSQKTIPDSEEQSLPLPVPGEESETTGPLTHAVDPTSSLDGTVVSETNHSAQQDLEARPVQEQQPIATQATKESTSEDPAFENGIEVSDRQNTEVCRVPDSSLVIPDSQDCSGDRLSSTTSTSVTVGQQISQSDTISGIHSRQPRQTPVESPSVTQDLVATESQEHSASNPGPGFTHPHAHRPVLPSQCSPQPLYATQPLDVVAELPEIPSSITSRPPDTQEESQHPFSTAPFAHVAPVPRETQAAQIVHNGLDSFPDRITESGSISHCCKSNSNRETTAALPPESGYSPIMEQSFTSKPDGPVADDLRSLIDFGDSAPNPDGTGTAANTEENSSAEARNEPPLSPAQPLGSDVDVPQVVVRSPEGEVSSQHPFPIEPWKPEAMATAPEEPLPSISPASIMASPQRSAVDTLREIVDLSFGSSSRSIAQALMGDDIVDVPPRTVSPAEISHTVGVETSHTLLDIPDQTITPSDLQGTEESITMAQISGKQLYDSSALFVERNSIPSEYIVTLPFQASRRPYYDELLVEKRLEVRRFGLLFSREIYQTPDAALERKIDHLFGELLNICDYPQDVVGTKLEELEPIQLAKYSTDANPKFNFTYEFLQAIDSDTEVLIVARTPELLRLLYAVTQALGVECVAESIGKTEDSYKDSAARVTLTLANEDLQETAGFDVVIGFDHAFGASPVAQRFLSSASDGNTPLILQLVTSLSIEHIGLYVSNELSTVEKKNALLGGIVRARQDVQDPDRGYDSPHEIATIFSNYINRLSDAVEWEPQPIPEHILDIYVNTQPRTQVPAPGGLSPGNGMKRKLDDAEEHDSSKRKRIFPVHSLTEETNNPPLPDAVEQLLNDAEPNGDATKKNGSSVLVSLTVLETLAEKLAELNRQKVALDIGNEAKDVIDRLESEVKEYRRTASRMSESHRKALQDRSTFEKDKVKVEQAAKAAAEAAEKETDKHKKRIAELEAAVARLTADSNSAAESDSVLAKTERLLEEVQNKVQMMEKRLENSQRDNDYVRSLYQDVNSRAGAMGSELEELRAQNTHLQQTASSNLVKVHEIQAANATKEQLRTIAGLQAQLREREIELDRHREEIRVLRNGRPQTRGASVPQSPRMASMMSPRPPRAFSGPASRGTSPAPTGAGYDGGPNPNVTAGVQFMGQQSGNGRWGHLKS